jgi:hypothetical protein
VEVVLFANLANSRKSSSGNCKRLAILTFNIRLRVSKSLYGPIRKLSSSD